MQSRTNLGPTCGYYRIHSLEQHCKESRRQDRAGRTGEGPSESKSAACVSDKSRGVSNSAPDRPFIPDLQPAFDEFASDLKRVAEAKEENTWHRKQAPQRVLGN